MKIDPSSLMEVDVLNAQIAANRLNWSKIKSLQNSMEIKLGHEIVNVMQHRDAIGVSPTLSKNDVLSSSSSVDAAMGGDDAVEVDLVSSVKDWKNEINTILSYMKSTGNLSYPFLPTDESFAKTLNVWVSNNKWYLY